MISALVALVLFSLIACIRTEPDRRDS